MAGIEIERDLERVQRVGITPVADQGEPQVVVRPEVVQRHRGARGEFLDGGLEIAPLVRGHALREVLERLRAHLAGVTGPGRGASERQEPDRCPRGNAAETS